MFKLEYPNEKIIISHFLLLFLKPMDSTSYVVLQIKKSTYFTIQLIFAPIYESHCTF